MTPLDGWFEQIKSKQKHFVSIQEALVTNQISKYAFFRLRFAGLNIFILFIVHLIEFILLSSIFTIQNFVWLFFLRVIALMLRSGWWGALEILRSRVRILYRENDLVAIRREISNWLFLSGIFAFIFLVMAIVVMSHSFGFKAGIGISGELFKSYLFVILLQVGIHFIVLTYHAGVYAIRRVPRPFFSVAITDVLAIIIVLLVFPVFNVMSLPYALLISMMVSGWLTVFYSNRAYHSNRFYPLVLPSLKSFFSFLRRLLSWEFVLASIAAVVLSLDGLMITFILLSQQSSRRDELVIAVYLIAPLIRATSEWTIMFYFDLKIMFDPLLRLFIKAFTLKVLQVALFIAWVLSLVSLGVLLVLKVKHVWVGDAVLIFFLSVLSCNAYLQMKIFCDRGYWNVIVSGILFILPLVLLHGRHLEILYQIFFLDCCYTFMFIFLLVVPLWKTISVSAPIEALSSEEWRHAFSKMTKAGKLFTLHLVNSRNVFNNRQIANNLAAYLHSQGCVRYDSYADKIVCYVSSPAKKPLSREWFALNMQGLIDDIQEELIMPMHNASIKTNRFAIRDATVAAYLVKHPHALVILPSRQNKALKILNRKAWREILPMACRFVRGLSHQLRTDPYEVEACVIDGKINAVFLTPITTPKNKMP